LEASDSDAVPTRKIALRQRFYTRFDGYFELFGAQGGNQRSRADPGGRPLAQIAASSLITGLTDDPDRSIFRYHIGQAIACFWLLNASALRHRRVIAPIDPDLLPVIAALSAARHALSPFE
jgi:hypothetical protein